MRVDEHRRRRAGQVEESSPQPSRAGLLLEGPGVGRNGVEGQDVQADRHAIARVLREFGDEERIGEAELGEHVRILGQGSGVVEAIAGPHQRGSLIEEALVVGARHEQVDVVVPGDEALMADGADHRAPVDRIGDAEPTARGIHVVEHLHEELVDSGEEFGIVDHIRCHEVPCRVIRCRAPLRGAPGPCDCLTKGIGPFSSGRRKGPIAAAAQASSRSSRSRRYWP